MLDHEAIAALIPHQGAMCLLDRAHRWSEMEIECSAISHLDAGNPLRRDGCLGILCGAEYGFQAAALHGALLAGGVPQRPGFLVALRLETVGTARLDDPAHGPLNVRAMLHLADESGLIYNFELRNVAGASLLAGRATIRLSPR